MFRNLCSSIASRTVTFLSCLYIFVSGFFAVFVVSYVSYVATSFLEIQEKDKIITEAEDLLVIYETYGMFQFLKEVEWRSRNIGQYLYLVRDDGDRVIIGNIEHVAHDIWEKVRDKEVFYADLYGPEKLQSKQVISIVVNLSNGVQFLVSSDISSVQNLSSVIRQSLIAALIIMCLGSLVIGFFVAQRALQKIDNLRRASKKIMQGNLSGRLPVLRLGDAFDLLAQDLNVMLERMDNLNRELLQISDNISHDLKTPLTRLRNRIQLVLDDSKPEETNYENLQKCLQDADNLIHTFNSMLMIARCDGQASFDDKEEICVQALLDDIFELYEPVVEEEGLTLEKGSLVPAVISGNKQLISQVLSNLIDNAIKYARVDGREGIIKLDAEWHEDGVNIIIEDNGPGVAKEDYEKITQRFARLDGSRTQAGFGLGLSLVKAVIKLHNGRMTFEDAKPGLRVVLFFNLVDE